MPVPAKPPPWNGLLLAPIDAWNGFALAAGPKLNPELLPLPLPLPLLPKLKAGAPLLPLLPLAPLEPLQAELNGCDAPLSLPAPKLRSKNGLVAAGAAAGVVAVVGAPAAAGAPDAVPTVAAGAALAAVADALAIGVGAAPTGVAASIATGDEEADVADDGEEMGEGDGESDSEDVAAVAGVAAPAPAVAEAAAVGCAGAVAGASCGLARIGLIASAQRVRRLNLSCATITVRGSTRCRATHSGEELEPGLQVRDDCGRRILGSELLELDKHLLAQRRLQLVRLLLGLPFGLLCAA